MLERFQDRLDAGQALAAELRHWVNHPDTVVLALPRGGVPVAFEVAKALNLPLDVFMVRKLGLPGHEELAIGAIASGGTLVLNEPVIQSFAINDATIQQVRGREQRILEEREREYRDDRPPPRLEGQNVILIDDGLATGSTIRAAIAALKQQHPARIIIGAPVGAVETCRELEAEVDEMVCVATPEPFMAVGLWYRDFSQTSDEEVRQLLDRSLHPAPAA